VLKNKILNVLPHSDHECGLFYCVSSSPVFPAVCPRANIPRLRRFRIFYDPAICETFTKYMNLCAKLDIIKTVDVFISLTFARNNKCLHDDRCIEFVLVNFSHIIFHRHEICDTVYKCSSDTRRTWYLVHLSTLHSRSTQTE
jgi:hypothetical protein